MFDFTDRVALVSGANGNLGRAVAQAFYDAGARVVLADRRVDDLPALGDDAERVMSHAVDLMQPESARALARAALDRFGRIDAVVNTVGGFRSMPVNGDGSLEMWDFVLNLNARTALILSQAVVPVMRAQGRGAIVHTAARAALSGGKNIAAYTASKSAVIRLTESLAAELKDEGINVNCVLPGTIDTPENRAERPNADFSKWVAPEALASVYLFLCSDAAQAIQGAAIPVYGRS